MHSEEEVEVDSEEEVEVDTEEDEAHVSVEENFEEVGNLDNSDSEYRMEDSDNEAEGHGRGLSDDEWESDVLLTPDDSASEDDETEDRPSRGPFPTFGKKKSMSDYKWELGTIFTDKDEFKEAIRSYAIHAGRALKFVKNDNRRVRVRCMGGQKKCPWVAYCGYFPSRKIWQLRKIVDVHSCSRQLNIKLMNSKWLSHEIDKSMHDNPSIKVQDIHTKALRKWNTNVSISKARRAKLMASSQCEGDFKEQFQRIYDYAHEVLRSNPGSTVKVKVNSDNGQSIFQRCYVCLKACKDSFISCRPIICLDGCFLKGLYKGELLTAVGRDPNEQMLPLAYAVVEVENKDSWSWFLQLLVEDLGGNEVCQAYTWMSDQQKGLVPAIQEFLPRAEQRFCIRHLYANFRKRFSGQILKNLMWRAATSTYPQAWEREMLNIRVVNEEAYKYLIAIPPRYWSRSRFRTTPMCDTLDNNISEGFNSVLVQSRGKPIITMLEDIRLYLMKRWATNRTKVAGMDFNVCPKIKKRHMKECNLSRYWIPSWSARRIFEVRHVSIIGNKFTVDLDNEECSCRKWMISGIPCCHAVASMNYSNVDPESFIPICFRKSTYEETYASIIYPVNGHLLWEKTSSPDVLPPPKRNMLGRPKKKRRMEPWELTKDGT
ncbi:uncharacterized protein LOC108319449 [Vigna angularis]|uniref:uncharacterized protein LOC108319449 n=1 Tax=Phaseolus angularis TaxID=3914 RepID=UPI0022B2EF8F|nr:uncharacterized protein LOC108319449 [Vigna angularis]